VKPLSTASPLPKYPVPQRKPKQKKSKRITAQDLQSLPPLHLNAAGIDVGSAEHYVAVPATRDPQPVQKFGSFTADLHRLAQWLKACHIETVAMQATGVYWMGLYQVLQDYGFEVQVVNARHTKSLPGRKSDVQECQWLQQLHTFGLLNRSFHPAEAIRVLRSYMRQRENLVAAGSTCMQHLQKTLTEMNVQLANVISDLSGTTGMRILHAIVGGERDAYQLAELKHSLIRASRQQIAQSLQGNWREELLFVLRQNLELYEMYQQKVRECDQQIEAHLKTIPARVERAEHPIPPPRRVSWSRKRQPGFDLRGELYRLTGVDLTQVDGLDVQTIQTVISEVGLDMSAWKTEKHFGSWLGLSPDNRISGGKVLRRGTRKVVNRAATALRLAAWSLIRSQSALGAKFRRLRTRLGAPKAITAMAYHLARLLYRMLKFGHAYVDKGIADYETKYRQRQLAWLKKQAASLNMQLVPFTEVAA
jgi:transposase